MQNSIVIQPIDIKHFNALAAFTAEQFSRVFGHLYEKQHLDDHLEEKYSVSFYEQELARGCKILAAQAGDDIIGYIKYGPMGLPIEHSPESMEIQRLYVHPNQQGGGIGQKLTEAALDDMAAGVDIYLGVWSENLSAQAFYKRFGFEKVGDDDYIVGPHTDHEFILKRKKSK